MLYSPRRVAAATASVSILFGSIALAGCSSSSNATITHNPPLSTFGGKSTARSAVQSAILVANTSNGIAVFGGPAPAAMGRLVLDVMRGRHISAATGACTGGMKRSQVTNADGSATITTDLYYDAACATLEEEQVLSVITPGLATTGASGTVTTYDRSATVTSYHTITIAASNAASKQTVTYNDSAATTIGGAAIAAVGETCTGTANSPAMTCSAAMYGTTANATFGQALTTTGTAGTGGANNTVTVAISFYGTGITGISQSTGTWNVTGTSAFNTGSGTYGYSSTGSSGSGTMSLTDSLYTYTVTGTLAATGLAVTIVRNADPIATAAIDTAGNGLITYADGSTDTVWGDVIDV